MKKTLFTAMLAAALPGGCGVALANTGYSQEKGIAEDSAPDHIYAVTAQSSPGATQAALLVNDDEDAAHESLKYVFGGYATSGASAYDNLVTMTGGKVTELLAGGYVSSMEEAQASDNSVVVNGGEMPGMIAGGYVKGNGNADNNTVAIGESASAAMVYGGFTQNGHANGNTVTLSGGRVSNRLVGGASFGEGNIGGNTAIVTAGSVETVCGAYFNNASEIKGNKVIISGGNVGTALAYSQHPSKVEYADNVIIMSGGKAGALKFAERIHLVGAGFNGTIEGVEEIVGQALECGTASCYESIDIYGSRISGVSLSAGKALNFHLMTGDTSMVTLSDTLTLAKGLTLSFDALENMEWKPGDTVTLVKAQNGMTIAPEVLAKEYNIYQNGDPEKIMAVARLELEQGQDTTRFLKLVFTRDVPEPTTGTLCLLALAGLAARRRRK